jgi:hypothetical protein
MLDGCGPALTRPPVTQQDLLKLRTTGDEQFLEAGRKLRDRVIERTKTEYDRYAASGRKEPPVIDILIISGGGDWGPSVPGSSRGGRRCRPGTRWPNPSSTP